MTLRRASVMVLGVLLAVGPGSAEAQIARNLCPVREARLPVDDKWLFFVMAARAAQDDAAYRVHAAAASTAKAEAIRKRPLAKAWAAFAHVEVDAAGNVVLAKDLIGKSPFRKNKHAPENAVLASIVASIGQPGIGHLSELAGVDGASQSADSRAEGEWATSSQTLPVGVVCPHCLLSARFDKENAEVVEVRNELVTITNDLHQRPNFDIGLARDIVWSIFGTTTSRAAPMMALRDPDGNGRLVWGLYVNVMCGTEMGLSARSLSYAMDPRSYAIVGAFSDTYSVFNAIPRGHHGYPVSPSGLPGWQTEPTYPYGPKGPPVWRRAPARQLLEGR
jgi:hypothetical protein